MLICDFVLVASYSHHLIMDYSNYAKQFLGIQEGSETHKQIIDEYNKIKPLPRNYKVKYNDAWCATFVSFVMSKCNAINAPYECSVYYMYQKAKTNKQIVNTPMINDLVVYDWGNNGTYDHVGIIADATKAYLKVYEGNKNDTVGVRYIDRNSKEIKAFIRVPTKDVDINEIANDVIRGRYGNGIFRKYQLESMGYNYNEIQKLVNEKLRSLK